MAALGMGRYRHFVQQTRGMDLGEASVLIRAQATRFNELRHHLIEELDQVRAAGT